MSDCHAVLLDAIAIQEYIFKSNKLRENVGASHLVSEIYRSHLACALCRITGRPFKEELEHLDDWKQSDADRPDGLKPVEIGYIGGGNALLFFRDERTALQFIEEWTKILLVRAPGLTTAIAHGPFSRDPSEFQVERQKLFKQLEINKARYSPITSLAKHGITSECPRSAATSELHNKIVKDYVSAGVNARIEAATESKKESEREYRKQGILDETYCFSNELEDLGNIRGEDSHIAIVHIDGNDIGEHFKHAPNLRAVRKLSVTIQEATTAAFKECIITVCSGNKYECIMQSLGYDPIATDQEKRTLPIRPIIIGGDDVTFVCDGKLGIYFAEIFMKKFEEAQIEGKGLTSCAGVAIIKTKYPF